MRAALWFLSLFGIAVAIALFAGNNQGTVTLFWPPFRIDLSLNLVLLLLVILMVVLYLAARALSGLLDLPRQARFWRGQQKERAMHAALLDGMGNMMAGRFLRARKDAESALAQQRSLALGVEAPHHVAQLSVLAHLLVAESAQALQDKTRRDEHLQLALVPPAGLGKVTQEVREGAQLRAARWALDDREPQRALRLLSELPQGVARRTVALRIKLKAARLAGQTQEALETTRLLTKHGAFSPEAATAMVRGLALEFINAAHDSSQLQRVWASLSATEREMPELAVHAVQRLLSLQGDTAVARAWLLPVWEHMAVDPAAFEQLHGESWRHKLVMAVESTLDASDAFWLSRLEALQTRYPRLADLQYLVAVACLKRQLWGKAQQLITQACLGLSDEALLRRAWRVRAELAERHGDSEAALDAWKQAARI